MMSIAGRGRKFMRMEIIISDYGMVKIQAIYFSMVMEPFIIKKEKLFIKEFGKIINMKLMISF
jgi:hypothetical protein